MPRNLHHPELSSIGLADVMAALADPVRQSIVAMAESQEGLPCRAFTESIPKSTASHHWRVLRQAGVIRQQWIGTEKRNFLRRDELNRRFPGLMEPLLAAISRELKNAG